MCPALPLAGYPEQYLARCKLPKAPLHSIVTQGLSKPPSALHQHASAQQLYIVLYFLPAALHGDNALMKAVVARHFRHSWVLPWAPGHFADISLHWQRYRAARNALGAALTPAMARQLAATHGATALPLQRRRTQNLQQEIAKVSSSASCYWLCVLQYTGSTLVTCSCELNRKHVYHHVADCTGRAGQPGLGQFAGVVVLHHSQQHSAAVAAAPHPQATQGQAGHSCGHGCGQASSGSGCCHRATL